MGYRHLRRNLIFLASEFPDGITVDSRQRVIDRHTRIAIEPVAPIEIDVERRHDDADHPKSDRSTILEPDVYQAEYRGQYVEPMLTDE